jgi:hypothetical protein
MENIVLLTQVFENLAPFYVWAYNGPMENVNFTLKYEQVGASGVWVQRMQVTSALNFSQGRPIMSLRRHCG